MEYNIKLNKENNRFETEVDGLLCLVDFTTSGDTLIVTHTEVPKVLEGRGIAGAMTKYLLNYIRENGLKVSPICSYTYAYIKRHPEYNDIVKIV